MPNPLEKTTSVSCNIVEAGAPRGVRSGDFGSKAGYVQYHSMGRYSVYRSSRLNTIEKGLIALIRVIQARRQTFADMTSFEAPFLCLLSYRMEILVSLIEYSLLLMQPVGIWHGPSRSIETIYRQMSIDPLDRNREYICK